MSNPFPGMNPYLELRWQAVHARLAVYLSDHLQRQLPSGLEANVEETVLIDAEDKEEEEHFRPDVHVTESWDGSTRGSGGLAVADGVEVAKPKIILWDPPVRRDVVIRDSLGIVVTAIEILSPGNKDDNKARREAASKRDSYVECGANYVEIDLLRTGDPVSVPREAYLDGTRAIYAAVIIRAARPEHKELYPMRLRKRLSVLPIPLRRTDADITLDLQAVMDETMERGRYSWINYKGDPHPPLPREDAEWLDGLLKEKGLR